jgi:hypothetical protein
VGVGVFDNFNWVWVVVGIRGSLYNCLIAIVNEAGGTGVIDRMSVRLLAERANISTETARQHQRTLETQGFIKREKRSTPAGKRASNRIYLNRGRLFPRDTKEYRGEKVGRTIWNAMLLELGQLRGPANIKPLIAIKDVFFDCSNRTDARGDRRGMLFVVADTDDMEKSFREHLMFLLRIREHITGYEIQYIRLIRRPRFKN